MNANERERHADDEVQPVPGRLTEEYLPICGGADWRPLFPVLGQIDKNHRRVTLVRPPIRVHWRAFAEGKSGSANERG